MERKPAFFIKKWNLLRKNREKRQKLFKIDQKCCIKPPKKIKIFACGAIPQLQKNCYSLMQGRQRPEFRTCRLHLCQTKKEIFLVQAPLDCLWPSGDFESESLHHIFWVFRVTYLACFLAYDVCGRKTILAKIWNNLAWKTYKSSTFWAFCGD